jgi:hypothetical protein
MAKVILEGLLQTDDPNLLRRSDDLLATLGTRLLRARKNIGAASSARSPTQSPQLRAPRPLNRPRMPARLVLVSGHAASGTIHQRGLDCRLLPVGTLRLRLQFPSAPCRLLVGYAQAHARARPASYPTTAHARALGQIGRRSLAHAADHLLRNGLRTAPPPPSKRGTLFSCRLCYRSAVGFCGGSPARNTDRTNRTPTDTQPSRVHQTFCQHRAHAFQPSPFAAPSLSSACF